MSKKIAAVALGLAVAAGSAVAGNVAELTPSNYDDVVGGDKGALVEFFAPWCGHCKALAPKFEEAATLFKGKDAVLASVDCDAHSDLCGKEGVRGYPTLKYFPAGSSTSEEYEGGREVTDLVSFVNKKAGTSVRVKVAPSMATVGTDANFEKEVFGAKAGAFVEFYAPWCGHCKRLAPDYEKLGKAFAGEDVNVVKVDATENRKYAEKFGVSGYPTLMWFPAGEKEPTKYSGGRSLSDMITYINEQAGTDVGADGSVGPSAGRIEAMDALVKEFKAASGDARAAVLAKAEALVAEVKDGKNGAFAKYYVAVMKRVVSKGDGFVATEKARIAGMLDNDSVKPAKAAQFAKRANIIGQFA